jgi:phosphomannomutase
MVTGSHIPADRNGLKFYGLDGEITKADEEGILAALGDAPEAEFTTIADDEALARYTARADVLAEPDALKGLTIGVWEHSSVARDMLVSVLAAHGANVLRLNRSDVFVPIDTEAVSAADTAQIAEWVHANRLDALVSTDGDADRPLVADESGAVIRGDLLGLLTARFLGADTVVTPVTSLSSIEVAGAFTRVVRTRVGSPFVLAEMARAEGRVVGFEANGGVMLGSGVALPGGVLAALPTRDALLPILAVLLAARRAGKALSQLVAELPPRAARSDRLRDVPEARSAALMQKLRTDAAGFFKQLGSVRNVSDVDGLRFTLDTGEVVHYRPSGNAPELRCYVEADTPKRADELLAWGLGAAEAVVR